MFNLLGVATFNALDFDYGIARHVSWLNPIVVSDKVSVLSFKQVVNLFLIRLVVDLDRKSDFEHAFDNVQEIQAQRVGEVDVLTREDFEGLDQVPNPSFARIAEVLETVNLIDVDFLLLFDGDNLLKLGLADEELSDCPHDWVLQHDVDVGLAHELRAEQTLVLPPMGLVLLLH